jgi:hypothetical protein
MNVICVSESRFKSHHSDKLISLPADKGFYEQIKEMVGMAAVQQSRSDQRFNTKFGQGRRMM